MISCCLVTYRCQSVMTDTLRSLQKAAEKLPLTVYAVDNGSRDGTAETIRRGYPFIHLIQNAENRGFGRAHNAALPLLTSRYHLILNPDITFEPETLLLMVRCLDANPQAAAVTPRILNADGTEQRLPKRAPTVRYLLGGMLEGLGGPFARWRREYERNEDVPENLMGCERYEDIPENLRGCVRNEDVPKNLKGRVRNETVPENLSGRVRNEDVPENLRGRERNEDITDGEKGGTRNENGPAAHPGGAETRRPVPVKIAAGCFLLARTGALQKLGGFDERFFLYLEDTDLSRRLLQEGDILFLPEAEVTHLWQRESHRKLRLRLIHIVSAFRYFHKWGWRL